MKNFTPVPSASTRPPTKTYGLLIAHTIVPVFPSSAVRPCGPDVTFSAFAPLRHVSFVKSGRYYHRPLQMM